MILGGGGFVQGVHTRVGDSGCVARTPSWGCSFWCIWCVLYSEWRWFCHIGPHMIYYKCCIECDIFHCPGVCYWDGGIAVYEE